jgi:hypothetical protein
MSKRTLSSILLLMRYGSLEGVGSCLLATWLRLRSVGLPILRQLFFNEGYGNWATPGPDVPSFAPYDVANEKHHDKP